MVPQKITKIPQKGYPFENKGWDKIFEFWPEIRPIWCSDTRWVRIRRQKNFKKFPRDVRVSKRFATFCQFGYNFLRLKWTPNILYLFLTARGRSFEWGIKETRNDILKKVDFSTPTLWPIWPPKVHPRLKYPTIYNFPTLYPPTSLPGPTTPHFSKTCYNTLKFSSGHFGATLKCGTKTTHPKKFPIGTYLIPPKSHPNPPSRSQDIGKKQTN